MQKGNKMPKIENRRVYYADHGGHIPPKDVQRALWRIGLDVNENHILFSSGTMVENMDGGTLYTTTTGLKVFSHPESGWKIL